MIQIAVLTLFLILGILRLQDSEFPFLIPINSFSIIVSVLFIFLTAIEKINRYRPITTKQKVRIDKLQGYTVIVTLLGVSSLTYLCYHSLVSTPVADFLSIAAFGMSCANGFLSNALIYDVCKESV
ncbi:hypothetical protein ACFW1P_32895 [Paenibacillus sp. NPDC058910]|uniref:hypothetical protein n=1 Tax=unclassified Paenibacillus TaxID=185978 RepID=UPI00369B07BD